LILLELNRAITFALQAHEGQMRKAKNVPFIAHPLAVAMLIQGMGCPQHVVIAALLHDTVEDTPITLDQLHQNFGDEVADLVGYLTEPRGRWEYRKETYIAQITSAPFAAKLISAVDKYHNLHNIYQQQKDVGDSIWGVFSRGKRQQAWFYRSVYAGILYDNPQADNYPIFQQLGELIEDIFGRDA
jgi:(p)ppGpp synthase/HD superfamily hydrolase